MVDNVDEEIREFQQRHRSTENELHRNGLEKENLSEIKILFERLNRTLELTEERISELEHKSKKISKQKLQVRREKRIGRKRQGRACNIYGTMSVKEEIMTKNFPNQ